jgi:excinuclease ABC subunit C
VSLARPDASQIPDAPGAYLFRDVDGRVVYIGKAKSLRKRLLSYWGRPLHPRTQAMVNAAANVEWILAATEVDALMLEYNLIKSHVPRFNVRYRDDKSYPYLALTVSETWPRARVMRGAKRKGVRYFGPYGHAYAIRETLDALTRVFPVRTCSDSFFDQRARAGRPCLSYDIGRCAGPCVPSTTGVTEDGYARQVEALADFLSGNYSPVLDRLSAEMREAADGLEFERAAKLRDQVAAARKAIEHQEMVLRREEDLDVIGMDEDDLEAAFQVFFVRRGRVMGRKGYVVDKVEAIDAPALLANLIRELYMERGPGEVPPRILVPCVPEDAGVLEEWLGRLRRRSKVRFQIPQRGDGRKLLQVVTHNAKESFVRHKLKRASDFGARSRALAELGDVLGLPVAPLRIECFDISNLGPTDRVDERGTRQSGRRFAYPPSLIVVDGGKGQLGVAERVLERRGLDIPVIGLAKRLEEVFVPGQPDPLDIPRGSEALFVLQHLRDEAHRFAITYHRQKRSKRALRSELDDIPGVGPTRRKALLKRFGSVAAIRRATEDELAATPGIGPALARDIAVRLHAPEPAGQGRRAG